MGDYGGMKLGLSLGESKGPKCWLPSYYSYKVLHNIHYISPNLTYTASQLYLHKINLLGELDTLSKNTLIPPHL